VDERLRAAIDAQLDAALGPPPTELVEDRGDEVDIDAVLLAEKHLWRAPMRWWGTG